MTENEKSHPLRVLPLLACALLACREQTSQPAAASASATATIAPQSSAAVLPAAPPSASQAPATAPLASSSSKTEQLAVAPPGMVLVPAGEFTMGDDSDPKARPSRRVKVPKPFYIDLTEVTVAAYAKCTATRDCSETSVHGPSVKPEDAEKHAAKCNARYPERSEHPINCVDRTQAQSYCAWRDKRLPTEIEWEYAARGSDGRTYPWGNEAPGCERATVSGCVKAKPDRAGTQPVATYAAAKSPFELLDSAGNVWEWASGSWDGDVQVGVLRGGSWDFGPAQLKASSRLRFPVLDGHVSTGFRCAQDVQ